MSRRRDRREGLARDEWLDLARKLDWTFRYASEEDVYPPEASGRPWLPHAAWQDWEEPYRTTFREYVATQREKDVGLAAVRDAVGRLDQVRALDRGWVSVLKLYGATLPLAEFAAVIGNLRAARFGRDGAWRQMATFGALDELRHTQLPLEILHELVRWDPQFDWSHRFLHTNDWVAIAARHLVDELLLAADPVEFAIGTHFVFETGLTNLQFIGLSAMSRAVGDPMFESLITSIQTDEARHSQIGLAVLSTVVRHDRARAQYLLDKWFWRNWLFFAVVTGFSMDYLTPLAARVSSFREFVEEWVIEQFLRSIEDLGLERPWYWDHFLESIDTYHHMVYASAYTYRATVWFDFVLPGPEEREWLARRYSRTWPAFDAVWERVTTRWRETSPGVEWSVHGATPVTFCDLCQLVLCGGTPERNAARVVVDAEGRKRIFCSEPCAWIFASEPERYASPRDVVKRILAGEAPANLLQLLRDYFGLSPEVHGKDVHGGSYPWLERPRRAG